MIIINIKKAKNLAWLIMGALVTGVLFTACNQQDKKTNETPLIVADTTQPLVDTAKMRADWEQFKADANAKIDVYRDSIESFKTRIVSADKKMKIRYRARVAELERKNAELKNRLDDYKEAGKEKWDKFKMDFNNDMDKLRQEIKDSTATTSK